MIDATNELLLTTEQNPLESDVAIVRDGLLAFNIKHIGREPKSGSLNLFLRDAQDQVRGGLIGGWRWGWLYVDKLWVQDEYRKQGNGTRLLKAAEAQAINAECTDAVLDTFSFQAREFYERNGYAPYATLEGFPPGYQQFFLHKTLVK